MGWMLLGAVGEVALADAERGVDEEGEELSVANIISMMRNP